MGFTPQPADLTGPGSSINVYLRVKVLLLKEEEGLQALTDLTGPSSSINVYSRVKLLPEEEEEGL